MAIILVTGGAGYLGSHVCRRLAADGHVPVTFDNLATGSPASVQWGPFMQGDLRDRDALRRALAGYRPDAVVHCAGARSTSPDRQYTCDVAGILGLLEEMQEYGVLRIAAAGCLSVYGAPADPVAEHAPLAPADPVAVAKTIMERMLLDSDAAYGMRSVCLRLPPLAGADPQTPHAPPMAEGHLLARALSAAFGGMRRLPAGPDWRISDYLHVGDAADGIARSVRHLLSDGATRVFNLGTGKGSPPEEVVAAVERATGRRLSGPTTDGGPIAGPVPVVERAAAELGWRPSRSGLDPILSSMRGVMARRSVA